MDLPTSLTDKIYKIDNYQVISENETSITYSSTFHFKDGDKMWDSTPRITVPLFMKESLMRLIEFENDEDMRSPEEIAKDFYSDAKKVARDFGAFSKKWDGCIGFVGLLHNTYWGLTIAPNIEDVRKKLGDNIPHDEDMRSPEEIAKDFYSDAKELQQHFGAFSKKWDGCIRFVALHHNTYWGLGIVPNIWDQEETCR